MPTMADYSLELTTITEADSLDLSIVSTPEPDLRLHDSEVAQDNGVLEATSDDAGFVELKVNEGKIHQRVYRTIKLRRIYF